MARSVGSVMKEHCKKLSCDEKKALFDILVNEMEEEDLERMKKSIKKNKIPNSEKENSMKTKNQSGNLFY